MSSDCYIAEPAAAPCQRSGLDCHMPGDEAILYDVAHNAVHYLNTTAFFIWSRCDGQRSEATIARDLSDAFDRTSPDVEADASLLTDVRTTLTELASNGLIDFASFNPV